MDKRIKLGLFFHSFNDSVGPLYGPLYMGRYMALEMETPRGIFSSSKTEFKSCEDESISFSSVVML